MKLIDAIGSFKSWRIEESEQWQQQVVVEAVESTETDWGIQWKQPE